MHCNGGCLCGGIRWECETDSKTELFHCHCLMCRKEHGAPFVTFLPVKSTYFKWLAGEKLLKGYRTAPSSRCDRTFCPRCGSAGPLFTDEWVVVPAGCLDGDPGIRPMYHVFSASSPPWFKITDNLEQHDEYPERWKLPAAESPSIPAIPSGIVAGSCLCGKIVFHIKEPFQTVYNCHCGRCRKGRAAAHATNGFVSARAIQFVSGEQNLERYKVPEARVFAQVFCRTCGSLMPKVDSDRDIAVVPFGPLDVDPKSTAESNIHVAHKATWFDITDSLAQFNEGPPN